MGKSSNTIKLPRASLMSRIGTGVGAGLAEQLPKEIERGRLAEGLKQLGQQENLTPFQQFAGLASLPGVTPQIVQSGTDLLRQQAILKSLKPSEQTPYKPTSAQAKPFAEERLLPTTATTAESTAATLKPYIPPSGPEQEDMARRLMATEPQIYPTIEQARQAIGNQIAGNIAQSNALIQKRELEESVQSRSEQKLRDEIATVGANIPGTVLSNLQQKAVDDVVSGKMSPDQAKINYGKEANQISQDFANIRSWGNFGLITKNSKDLIGSINALQKNAKKGNYQKQAADALISENGLSPQFAYANMYPVSEIKTLNDELKSLPNIKPKLQKVIGTPGMAGVGYGRPKNENAAELTANIAPRLVRAMGLEGSPLAIGYELDKKGYDSDIWKKYLIDHQQELNLSSHQIDELQKPKPSFFGWLNDWWLRSFTGVQ